MRLDVIITARCLGMAHISPEFKYSCLTAAKQTFLTFKEENCGSNFLYGAASTPEGARSFKFLRLSLSAKDSPKVKGIVEHRWNGSDWGKEQYCERKII